MAKKAIAKKAAAAAKRKPGQRDLVTRETASAYAKRTAGGQFKELDDVGRSQSADRRKQAKTMVRSGFGDQGDQPKSTRKHLTKKH